MASCLESARLSSSPSWLFCQSCSTVPNLMTIPDLCHQHLLGAPCITLLLWWDPWELCCPWSGTWGRGVDPRKAKQTRAITATESSLLLALF